MKQYIYAFAIISILGGTTQLSVAKTNPSKAEKTTVKVVTLDVPGMFCSTCPFTVRKSLEKIDGVKDVKTDFKTKTAVVTYDPKKVDIKALIAATTNVGYPSTLKSED